MTKKKTSTKFNSSDDANKDLKTIINEFYVPSQTNKMKTVRRGSLFGRNKQSARIDNTKCNIDISKGLSDVK